MKIKTKTNPLITINSFLVTVHVFAKGLHNHFIKSILVLANITEKESNYFSPGFDELPSFEKYGQNALRVLKITEDCLAYYSSCDTDVVFRIEGMRLVDIATYEACTTENVIYENEYGSRSWVVNA